MLIVPALEYEKQRQNPISKPKTTFLSLVRNKFNF